VIFWAPRISTFVTFHGNVVAQLNCLAS
jgi:hypothetical protein